MDVSIDPSRIFGAISPLKQSETSVDALHCEDDQDSSTVACVRYGLGGIDPCCSFALEKLNDNRETLSSDLFRPKPSLTEMPDEEIGWMLRELCEDVCSHQYVEIGMSTFKCLYDGMIYRSFDILVEHFRTMHSREIATAITKILFGSVSHEYMGNPMTQMIYSPLYLCRSGVRIKNDENAKTLAVTIPFPTNSPASKPKQMHVNASKRPLMFLFSENDIQTMIEDIHNPILELSSKEIREMQEMEKKDSEGDYILNFDPFETIERRKAREKSIFDVMISEFEGDDDEDDEDDDDEDGINVDQEDNQNGDDTEKVEESNEIRELMRSYVIAEVCNDVFKTMIDLQLRKIAVKVLGEHKKLMSEKRAEEELKKEMKERERILNSKREKKREITKRRREIRKHVATNVYGRLCDDYLQEILPSICASALSERADEMSRNWEFVDEEEERDIEAEIAIKLAELQVEAENDVSSSPISISHHEVTGSGFHSPPFFSGGFGLHSPQSHRQSTYSGSSSSSGGNSPMSSPPPEIEIEVDAAMVQAVVENATPTPTQQIPNPNPTPTPPTNVLPEDCGFDSAACVFVSNVPFTFDRVGEITAFFESRTILVERDPDNVPRVHFLRNRDASPIGSCYVKLLAPEAVQSALLLHGSVYHSSNISISPAERPKSSSSGQKFAFTSPRAMMHSSAKLSTTTTTLTPTPTGSVLSPLSELDGDVFEFGDEKETRIEKVGSHHGSDNSGKSYSMMWSTTWGRSGGDLGG